MFNWKRRSTRSVLISMKLASRGHDKGMGPSLNKPSKMNLLPPYPRHIRKLKYVEIFIHIYVLNLANFSSSNPQHQVKSKNPTQFRRPAVPDQPLHAPPKPSLQLPIPGSLRRFSASSTGNNEPALGKHSLVVRIAAEDCFRPFNHAPRSCRSACLQCQPKLAYCRGSCHRRICSA